MPRVAIYPGSFDPLTNGHVSIIRRGISVFDQVIVAVAHNVRKSSALFSVEERVALIKAVFGQDNVQVDQFSGLLVDYADRKGCSIVLRGLRAMSDFEYEFQIASMNRRLKPDIETVFMMTEESQFYVSSRLVKEIAIHGGDVSSLVPPQIATELLKKVSVVPKPA